MSDKKRLAKKLLIISIFALTLFGLRAGYVFGVVLPQYSQSYVASLIDKMERLQRINESKIVLLGNSNVAFGFQSELIEKEFGMSVVNMGLHDSLGNAFHEQMALQNICEGDIYIICHSDYSDDDMIKNPDLAWQALENHWNLYRILRIKDVPVMLGSYLSYEKKAVNLWKRGTGNRSLDNCYKRDAFNEYGDNVFPREKSEYEFSDGDIVVSGISQTTVKRINKLNAYLTERGAVLLIAGYPIADGEYTPEAEEYEIFQKELAEKLDCPIISDFCDYMFSYDLFYDTVLHLTDEGAYQRTVQLIEDLKNYKGE